MIFTQMNRVGEATRSGSFGDGRGLIDRVREIVEGHGAVSRLENRLGVFKRGQVVPHTHPPERHNADADLGRESFAGRGVVNAVGEEPGFELHALGLHGLKYGATGKLNVATSYRFRPRGRIATTDQTHPSTLMAPVSRPAFARRPTFFKEWRETTGMNQYQAAERIGVEPSTLSRIETGDSNYSEFILSRMSDVYGCNPSDLIGWNPNINSAIVEIHKLLAGADEDQLRRALGMIRSFLGETPQT